MSSISPSSRALLDVLAVAQVIQCPRYLSRIVGRWKATSDITQRRRLRHQRQLVSYCASPNRSCVGGPRASKAALRGSSATALSLAADCWATRASPFVLCWCSTWSRAHLVNAVPAAREGGRPKKRSPMAASGSDRLGALPDELLHRVLSFLPAHEVVATSVLARRWRHLWKSVPAPRVTGVKDCTNPEWFMHYVDNLLLLRHPGARLDSFQLDLDERDFDFKPLFPTFDTNVNLWFWHALLCQARAISLRTTYGIYKYEDDDGPLELPSVPIISQHLKRLDLELVTLRDSTLDFSGCPTLVDLRCRVVRFLGICHPHS